MAELKLELRPSQRFDLIDVAERLTDLHSDFFSEYKHALYCSHHTTAGYIEQSVCDRLHHRRDLLQAYIRSYQKLFPPQANYRHDQLHLRTELSEEQRRNEPLNGDSHLTFISSGLENCVTYANRPAIPVYFIDLDGVCDGATRKRCTTVIGFNRAERITSFQVDIPVSRHRIDSINLRDARLGVYDWIQEILNREGITRGRVEISLAPEEAHAALTVNEYETLLMQHDLKEVLGNPMRYMAEKSLNILRDPRAVPDKVLNYAKYDLVHVVNRFLDAMGMSQSLLGRAIHKVLASQASRALQMKRAVRFMVTDAENTGQGTIVQGTYQSPILVQWNHVETQKRRLEVTFYRFE